MREYTKEKMNPLKNMVTTIWKYIATCSNGQFSKKKFPPLGMPYPTVVAVSREKVKAPWKDMGSPAGPSPQRTSASFLSTAQYRSAMMTMRAVHSATRRSTDISVRSRRKTWNQLGTGDVSGAE